MIYISSPYLGSSELGFLCPCLCVWWGEVKGVAQHTIVRGDSFRVLSNPRVLTDLGQILSQWDNCIIKHFEPHSVAHVHLKNGDDSSNVVGGREQWNLVNLDFSLLWHEKYHTPFRLHMVGTFRSFHTWTGSSSRANLGFDFSFLSPPGPG